MKRSQDLDRVAGEKRLAVKPKPGKDFRFPDSVRGRKKLIALFGEAMPADFLFAHQDREVFLDTRYFVEVELLVQIVDAAGDAHLRDQFRRTAQVLAFF